MHVQHLLFTCSMCGLADIMPLILINIQKYDLLPEAHQTLQRYDERRESCGAPPICVRKKVTEWLNRKPKNGPHCEFLQDPHAWLLHYQFQIGSKADVVVFYQWMINLVDQKVIFRHCFSVNDRHLLYSRRVSRDHWENLKTFWLMYISRLNSSTEYIVNSLTWATVCS